MICSFAATTGPTVMDTGGFPHVRHIFYNVLKGIVFVRPLQLLKELFLPSLGRDSSCGVIQKIRNYSFSFGFCCRGAAWGVLLCFIPRSFKGSACHQDSKINMKKKMLADQKKKKEGSAFCISFLIIKLYKNNPPIRGKKSAQQ